MARIRPYESQISAQAEVPGRHAAAQDFGGPGLTHLGQAVESAGASAAQVQRFALERRARQETTDAAYQVSQLVTDKVKEYDISDKAWKDGDPPLSETFMGRLKADLDKLKGDEEGSRFETQAGLASFQQHAQAAIQHFTALTLKGDATRAGNVVVQKHQTYVDGLANFVFTHPAYFALKRDEMHREVHNPRGMYADLSEDQRTKLIREGTERLAVSAVQGMIRKSPHVALDRLRDPLLKQDEQYGWMAESIPAEKLNVLTNQAETAIDALDAQRRLAEDDAERLHKKEINALEGTFSLGIVSHFKSDAGAHAPPLPDLTFANPDAMRLALNDPAGYRAVVGLAKELAAPGKQVDGDERFYLSTILPNVWRGQYATEMDVIRAGSSRLDKSQLTSALEQFHTYEKTVEAPVKQEYQVAEAHIRKVFAIPQGALINPPGVNEAGARATDRFNTWFAGLVDRAKTEGVGVFKGLDLLDEARRIADAEHIALTNEIISIIPRKRESLRYKSAAEAEAALKKREIDEREFNRVLQDLYQFEQMEQMVRSRPAPASRQGRVGKD